MIKSGIFVYTNFIRSCLIILYVSENPYSTIQILLISFQKFLSTKLTQASQTITSFGNYTNLAIRLLNSNVYKLSISDFIAILKLSCLKLLAHTFTALLNFVTVFDFKTCLVVGRLEKAFSSFTVHNTLFFL